MRQICHARPCAGHPRLAIDTALNKDVDGRDEPGHDAAENSGNYAMMGSRGYKGGDECDAFSRGSRRIIYWKRGALRAIKRRYWKRMRKNAQNDTLRTGVAAVACRPERM